MATILIADDEANIRTSLAGALGREGHTVETAASLAEARTKLGEAFDFVLLDVAFPDGNGLDLLAEITAAAPDTTVVMMSGHATIDVAVRATRLGAYDFLEKPVALERVLVLLRNATSAAALRRENRRLTASWASSIVGSSAAIRGLLDEITKAGPTSARILLTGENGTGKEVAARALHAASPRHGMPYLGVNCGAFPDELFESEMFGHERGAFTGAMQTYRGAFEQAQGGTLLLDEVGELSSRAQTKLLRVLESNEIMRVGGSRPIRVDVRVISATNRDLAAAVREKTFREDLFFRLAVIPIRVPALRERPEDVPALIETFAKRFREEGRRVAPNFSPEALELLRRYSWPGNVRELRNLVERLLIMTPGNRIEVYHARAALQPLGSGAPAAGRDAPLAEQVREFERARITAVLTEERGNMTKAAMRLGLERSHLYKKMAQLGMRPEN